MIGNIKYFVTSVWQECNMFLALYIYFLVIMCFTGIVFIIFSLLTGQVDTDNITWGLIDYV
jgi:hypothetical protein